MEERAEFIKAVIAADKPFKHICADFGISEKTGYKWKARYMQDGNTGLCERSRASATHPNVLSENAIIDLIRLKQAHPYWGAKKIQVLYAKAYPSRETPSLSSVNRVLDRAGLTKKRRVYVASVTSPRLNQHIQPQQVNDVWAIDFKGWWKSDGEKCEPLTVRDLTSRKILCARLMTSHTAEAVRTVMTEVFRTYGLPNVIRSDNGTPFTSTNGILTLTTLSVWWITLGILPDHTDKGKPGQNGSLERMHGDIAHEVEGKIRGGIKTNQVVLDAWVEEYNSVRPNEAIGFKTPDELYRPSERIYTGDYDEVEYPMGFLVRKVFESGEIMMGGIRVTLGSSLRGMFVGLRDNNDNTYDVFLADFLLGTLDMNTCCFTPLDDLKCS